MLEVGKEPIGRVKLGSIGMAIYVFVEMFGIGLARALPNGIAIWKLLEGVANIRAGLASAFHPLLAKFLQVQYRRIQLGVALWWDMSGVTVRAWPETHYDLLGTQHV